MRPRLRFSCSEGWDNMAPCGSGRWCSSCEKEVVDLTNLAETDLVRYLKEQGGSVCGRVRAEQVVRYHQLPEVFILGPVPPVRHGPPLLPFVAMGGVLLASCGGTEPPQATAEPQLQEEPSMVESEVDTTATTSQEKPIRVAIPPPIIDFVCGGIDIDDTTGHLHNHPHPFHNASPPEFPGGEDSLAAFIRKHLTYPEWEAEQDISGRVLARFTIDTDGSVIDTRIMQDIPEAKNFNDEVLRVISLMPQWTPAMQDDKPVAVPMSLPISFSRKGGL